MEAVISLTNDGVGSKWVIKNERNNAVGIVEFENTKQYEEYSKAQAFVSQNILNTNNLSTYSDNVQKTIMRCPRGGLIGKIENYVERDGLYKLDFNKLIQVV